MAARPLQRDRGGAGGIADAAAEVPAAVAAVRVGMDWRPLLGLAPTDAGSIVERVLALVVTARTVQEINASK